MKISRESRGSEKRVGTDHSLRDKRNILREHELEELHVHVDLISFNIEKVYRHAKDRSRKEYNKAKMSLSKKISSNKNIKSGLV